jgi:pilus assembly protein CpaC
MKVITFPVQGPAISYQEEAFQPAFEETRPSGPTITVKFGSATRIHLPNPALGSVSVADPDVADVQVAPTNTIYVYGKKNGKTTLYAEDSQGHVLLNNIIQVTHGPVSILRGITTDKKKEDTVMTSTYNSSTNYDLSNSHSNSNSTSTITAGTSTH